jgi:hypothetical protein
MVMIIMITKLKITGLKIKKVTKKEGDDENERRSAMEKE